MKLWRRAGILENIRYDDELLALILVYRWTAIAFAAIQFALARSVSTTGMAAVALAIAYTAAVTFAVAKRRHFRAWFALFDAGICGGLLFAGNAAFDGFAAYALGAVLLSSFLFATTGGVISATIVAGAFVTAHYTASPTMQLLPAPGEGALVSVGYTVAVLAAALFVSEVSRILARYRETAARFEEHVATLSSIYEVASSISSKFFLDDILESVVDNAKQVIRTDKTVLHLVDIDSGKRPLDRHMVAVRGSRSEHPESWWREQIEDVAESVIESGREQVLARDPEAAGGEGSWLVCVPAKVKDKPVGLLSAMNSYAKPFTENDVAALTILAGFAAVAIENARLINRAQMLLVADERNRIAKEMHDGLAQSLFSLVLNLQVCQKKVDDDPELVKEKMKEMQGVASRGLAELRRYIYDLRPKNLEEMGLIGAINFHLNEINKLNGSQGLLRTYGNRRGLSPRYESCIYRVVQEATNNIAKHAKVESFTVSLKYLDDRVELLVKDRGRGFDVTSALAAADKRKTFGLLSMRERIADLGGKLLIESSAEQGTEIRVALPLEEIYVGQS